MSELKAALKKLMNDSYSTIVQAKVKSVDSAKRICTVITLVSEAEIPDVRLNAVVDNNDMYYVLYPKVDSLVWVAFTDNSTDAVVIAVSEITKMEMRCDKIIFNKGLKKGLVLLEKVVQKLNNLEQQHNKALLDFVTHTHVDPLSGATGVIVVPPQATSIIPTQESELENTKIIQ